MFNEPDYTEARSEDAALTVTQIKDSTGYLIHRQSLLNNDSTSIEITTFNELIDLKHSIDDMIRFELTRMGELTDE